MATETQKKTTSKAASAKPKKAAAPKQEKPQAQAQPADTRNPLQRRGIVTGTVVSDKMQKTIVVRVDRQVRHRLYKKYIEKSRRYKAHDEKNEAKVGDRVTLIESRPLSREKRWVLQSIIRKAGQAPEINV